MDTSIIVQLFDSTTFEIKAIRVLSLNGQLKEQLVSLWQASVERGISRSDYDEWLDYEVYTRNVDYTFKNSRKLGYIKYGYNTKELILVESLYRSF